LLLTGAAWKTSGWRTIELRRELSQPFGSFAFGKAARQNASSEWGIGQKLDPGRTHCWTGGDRPQPKSGSVRNCFPCSVRAGQPHCLPLASAVNLQAGVASTVAQSSDSTF